MLYTINDTVIDWRELQKYWIDNNTSHLSTGAFQKYFHPDEFFAVERPGYKLPLCHGIHKENGYSSLLIQLNHVQCLGMNIYNDLRMNQPPSIPNHLYQATNQFDIKVSIMYNKMAYNKLVRKVKSANKRLNKSLKAQQNYQSAKDYVKEKKYVFVSIDIEAYELDHSILLEIGWTLYDSRYDRLQDQHYMMDSYKHLTNGRYVENQKLQFQFGKSIWCSLNQAFQELYKDLTWATQRDGGFILVGHGLTSDLQYLQKQNFKWPCIQGKDIAGNVVLKEDGVLDVNDSSLVAIINTDEMFGCYINDLHNPPSLGRCLYHFNIDHSFLHNAGNDAHYTMELMLALTDA